MNSATRRTRNCRFLHSLAKLRHSTPMHFFQYTMHKPALCKSPKGGIVGASPLLFQRHEPPSSTSPRNAKKAFGDATATQRADATADSVQAVERSGDVARIGHYRWVVCALLFFATTINYIDRQILSLIKPILDEQLPGGSGNLVGGIRLRGRRKRPIQAGVAGRASRKCAERSERKRRDRYRFSWRSDRECTAEGLYLQWSGKCRHPQALGVADF